MRCDQARQLFDAYLNGELAGSLATELGAHRLQCASCRRALALLEVSGQIIALDKDSVTLDAGFSQRLLACMEPRPVRWTRRLSRALFVAVPLATAAVITLALLGVLGGPDAKVAGEKVEGTVSDQVGFPVAFPMEERMGRKQGDQADKHNAELERWVEQMRTNIAAKRESGQSLQEYLNLTILQWIDILNSAKEQAETKAAREEHLPGEDPASLPITPVTPQPPHGPADE